MSRKHVEFSLRETNGDKPSTSDDKITNQKRTPHKDFLQKLASRALFITGFFVLALIVLYTARSTGFTNPERLQGLVQSSGVYGPLALIAVICFTSVSITIPSTPIFILAGAIYGAKLATIYCLIGVFIGASFAFWVARIFRKPIINLLGEHAQVLERFQQKYVMIVLFITRVVPIFSFEVMSYAAGLTSISYWQFLLATLGTLGSIFLLTSVGAAGASFAFGDAGGILPIVTALVMVLMLFIVPLAIDHYNPFGWKEKLLMQDK